MTGIKPLFFKLNRKIFSQVYFSSQKKLQTLKETAESLMNILIDSTPPKNAPLSAKYKRSFAYPSMKDRVPIILSKLVDYLYREKHKIISTHGQEAQEELKTVIGEISQLKNQLQTAKPLEKFSLKDPDAKLWNAHLEELSEKGVKLNYYEADWIFAECYLYRKLREIFATKVYLHSIDPFTYQKTQLLVDSLASICPILNHIEDEGLTNPSTQLSMAQKHEELCKLFKCSLWANRMDLSLSAGVSDVQVDLLDEVAHWDDNIIVNDLQKVSNIILGVDSCDLVINYVTDNAGLEVLCDLCLADFLVTKCNVKQLNFRVKSIPWFVSDTMITDFHQTIQTVKSFPHPLYQRFGERWQKFVDKGIWQLKSDVFWCLGLNYSEMPVCDPELYNELCASSFIIFKGDLNYRKLVQDTNWDPTIPFSKAVGKFHPAPLVALRTCKADTISGLKEGVAYEMDKKHNDWLVSGNFAVIQFDSP